MSGILHAMKQTPKELATVFVVMLRIGMFTFGGGLAMLPFIQAEFTERRKWLSIEESTDIMAAAQTLPGVIVVNATILTCYRLGGRLAATIGAIGVILPSLVLLSIISYFYNALIDNPYMRGALRGVSGAVAAMFASALVRMRKTSIIDWRTFIIFAASLAGILLYRNINIVILLLIGAALGFVIYWLMQDKALKDVNVLRDKQERDD